MLDDAQRQILLDWWQKKDIRIQCESCGHRKWSIGDIIAGFSIDGAGNTRMGGDMIPMVQVLCENCGHVRLYSAVKIGLVK